jgi:hypothetical protein
MVKRRAVRDNDYDDNNVGDSNYDDNDDYDYNHDDNYDDNNPDYDNDFDNIHMSMKHRISVTNLHRW